MNYEQKPLQFTVANRSEHMGIALGHGIAALIQLQLLSDEYEAKLVARCKDSVEITQMLKSIEAGIQTTNTTFNSLMSGYVALVVGNIVDCEVLRATVKKLHERFDLEISTSFESKPKLVETAKRRSEHYYKSADLILSQSFDTFAFPDLDTRININLGDKA